MWFSPLNHATQIRVEQTHNVKNKMEPSIASVRPIMSEIRTVLADPNVFSTATVPVTRAVVTTDASIPVQELVVPTPIVESPITYQYVAAKLHTLAIHTNLVDRFL